LPLPLTSTPPCGSCSPRTGGELRAGEGGREGGKEGAEEPCDGLSLSSFSSG
jgi:hypothetical protein